jgi:hypothetical protein
LERRSTVLQTSELEAVGGRLRAMSRDGGSIEAAQVKLIGLDEIREAAGPRWPRMRERVRQGSYGILSQHTGPDDVIFPAGDGFLIMLAEGRPGDTQRRCQQMRDALLAFYLGEDALKALRPEVNNRSLTAEGLTDLIASAVRDKPVVARSHGEDIAFAPVLLTREQKVGASFAAPVQRAAEGWRIVYNPEFILDGRHHDRRDYFELDIAVLDAALTRMQRTEAPMGVCVHSSVMQSRRSREAYLEWIAQLAPEMRRRLIVGISEIERGTPLISITEWCSALRALVAQVSLGFHYTDHAISSVGSTGAWSAGFHLPGFAGAQQEWRAEKLREQIRFWSRSLRTQGMRLMVHGFQDATFLEQAAELGVDMLTSDTHWPFTSVADAFEARTPSAHADGALAA